MKILIKLLLNVVLVTLQVTVLTACSKTENQSGQTPYTLTVTATVTPTTMSSTPIPTQQNDPYLQELSKVAGISSAQIPPGSYVSDAYLGTRTLTIKGKVLTMYCQAKTGNIEDFPLLGTHTYEYVLCGQWNTQPSLDNCFEISLKDVVSGSYYMVPFKNKGNYGIIVLGGDSYRIQ
ncbi:MAG: hypothetical protein C4542_02435 [Dehalococcoidia bacterium]|nr:MAG: hypothetical protein C4542_02435 [Dehalococcoidia bacterium]